MFELFLSGNLILAFTMYCLGVASPGPSNMAIMSTALQLGRKPALALAMGVIFGSFFWGLLAAFGLSLVISSYSNVLDFIKILGAFYLLYLAYKSAKSALSKPKRTSKQEKLKEINYMNTFLSGAFIHLTNPKAIFVWLSIVSFAMPQTFQVSYALMVVLGCSVLGIIIFCSYALIFSTNTAQKIYSKLRVYFESILSLLFAYAGYKMLSQELWEE
ncbi:MAG: LysE family translocator [Campylobacteraceae bacterium]|nr:LysE family translocator [Campylobacteraceae bacterium]